MTQKFNVLLVSSSGGVLLDLLALEPWLAQHTTNWAVVRAMDTETALSGHQRYWMKERHASWPFGVLAGIIDAIRVLRKVRPDVIISAGSGVAIGFFIAAKIFRITSFWIETFNFIDRPAITGRICCRLADEILVQRRSMLKVHSNAIFIGELY
jgi:UDP-N-acetylglucosamine:LPS N-acetylglucosamine transferase